MKSYPIYSKRNKWIEHSRYIRSTNQKIVLPTNCGSFKDFLLQRTKGYTEEFHLPQSRSEYIPATLTPKDYDITLAANALSANDKDEISHSTSLYLYGKTKDEIYRELQIEFNKTANLYHSAQISNHRYITIKKILQDMNTPIKLQTIPVFNEPMLDRRTVRYVERRIREWNTENIKQKVLEMKSQSLVLELLKLSGVDLSKLKSIK